jgi:DNA modification methylase
MSVEAELQMNIVHVGDALAVLRTLPACCVDAVITDPPAGINFMQKEFDSDRGGRVQWVAWLADIMAETMRVLKPGGHALVWALPRTSHWTACALEDAGFEIRDKLYHIFGSGYPKSLNISKAIDAHLGAEREKVKVPVNPNVLMTNANNYSRPWVEKARETGYHELAGETPVTSEAQQWHNWGTATKPAVEEWILCRRPLSESSVARNVLKWGTGGLNIGAARIGSERRENRGMSSLGVMHDDAWQAKEITTTAIGRWPSHLLLSHAAECLPDSCVEGCPVLDLDRQSGVRKSGATRHWPDQQFTEANTYGNPSRAKHYMRAASEGGASRYFQQFYYSSKASREERNLGCESLPARSVAHMGHEHFEPDQVTQRFVTQPQANIHPCVKPQPLMRWFCQLITPPHGIVLDPFTGSGSTGVAAIAEGLQFVGIELDPEYAKIAHARIEHALKEAERDASREKQLPMFESEQPKPASALLALPGLWDDEDISKNANSM